MKTTKADCSLKKVIRWFDNFGESFTFRYYDEDKLSTVLGGIISLCFYIIAILYFVYRFIPFTKGEIFNLQYYTMNLNYTEPIELAKEPIAFAVGFSVDDNISNIDDISKLLKIKFQFSIKHDQKEENGKNETNNETLDSYPCEKKDFHNKHDIAFDKLHINNFNCLKKNDLQSPEGIYTDEIFSYFKISVESQDKDNETHNQLINDYLTEHDCKLQFYYTDIAINIDNKDPFSSFLNSMFLQLNPTIIQKKNVFFMNYHLLDDDLLIHFNQNEEKEVIKTGLSRVEDYSMYKGLDRAIKKLMITQHMPKYI